jgi:hypothetical protein
MRNPAQGVNSSIRQIDAPLFASTKSAPARLQPLTRFERSRKPALRKAGRFKGGDAKGLTSPKKCISSDIILSIDRF